MSLPNSKLTLVFRSERMILYRDFPGPFFLSLSLYSFSLFCIFSPYFFQRVLHNHRILWLVHKSRRSRMNYWACVSCHYLRNHHSICVPLQCTQPLLVNILTSHRKRVVTSSFETLNDYRCLDNRQVLLAAVTSARSLEEDKRLERDKLI